MERTRSRADLTPTHKAPASRILLSIPITAYLDVFLQKVQFHCLTVLALDVSCQAVMEPVKRQLDLKWNALVMRVTSQWMLLILRTGVYLFFNTPNVDGQFHEDLLYRELRNQKGYFLNDLLDLMLKSVKNSRLL